MNFFDFIENESFFKPLTLKYRRIYYDCIQLLIEKMKELPVLYETDARDSITLYLKNADIRKAEETANEESGTSEEGGGLQAFAILSLFRDCGWLLPREIGRNGEYVTAVSTNCRRVMDFLRKMTEKNGEGLMSNRIFSMYEILKSVFDEDSMRTERPYANILVPLVENESELKNELTDLKNSISDIMKAVVAFQDINSFGQFIMKDEMLDRFFSEYFFVKNNGLIPVQLSFMRNRLREIRQGELYDKMVRECAEKLQLNQDQAQERVDGYFSELQYFLAVEYEENMELIDSRINNYYNLANTRIMLMAGNGMRMEAVLNDLLNAVASLDEKDRAEALEKIGECTRMIQQKYVSSRSFERNRRSADEKENIGLLTEELSEEEKQAKTEELFRSVPNRYSVDRVSSYLAVQMGADERIRMKDQVLKTREEALMYAAAVLYTENEEFPYEVQLSEETVDTGIASISDLTVMRKDKKRSNGEF
ncbi:MAG: DUF5716 family protein [Lachnospiraceae bacterium]|nr:DUF5716 family protein [Lachnospiraceae bacterium]